MTAAFKLDENSSGSSSLAGFASTKTMLMSISTRRTASGGGQPRGKE
jgi:hypothetical protein